MCALRGLLYLSLHAESKEIEQLIPHMLLNTYLMLLTNVYFIFRTKCKGQFTSSEANDTQVE